LAGLQHKLAELEAQGAGVVAASVDSEEETRELASKLSLSFPLAWGVTRQMADRIGAWWGLDRGIVQPAEFIVTQDNRVLSSTYSSGPIGRAEPADILALVGIYEKRRLAGA
jgi:peroxiredoxin